MFKMPHFRVFCDVETSGDCPIRNGVVAACFLIVNENDEVVDEFVRYVRPPNFNRKTFDIVTQQYHGFSYEQILGFMPNDQFCYELLCFLGKYKFFFPLDFVCHASNTGFHKRDPITKKSLGSYAMVPWIDWTFMEWCFKKAFFQNGDEMAPTFYKVFQWNEISIEIDGQEKPKLLNSNTRLISTIQMARQLGYKGNRLNDWAKRVGFDLNHHDATSDTYCCVEVFKFLWPKYKDEILKYGN